MIEVSCPGCRKEQSIDSSEDLPFFPFCSKRCSENDLGKWVAEDYFVEVEDDGRYEDNYD